MTHQPHALSNLNLAQKYFDSLPSDDISRKYYAGENFTSGFVNRIKFFFSIGSYLGELNKFYPYQPVVKETQKLYKEKMQTNTKNAVTFSCVSIATVYFLAKQNIVLPFFSKFCALGTHRLFRQYLALAFLPYFFAEGYTNYFFLAQTQKLWGVHAERMNQKLLSDPESSQYPIDLLPKSQIHSYVTPHIHPYDLPKKRANEVDIMEAPDYENIEEWQKKPLKEPEQDEQGEGQDDE